VNAPGMTAVPLPPITAVTLQALIAASNGAGWSLAPRTSWEWNRPVNVFVAYAYLLYALVKYNRLQTRQNMVKITT
jgi:hypothetical protein